MLYVGRLVYAALDNGDTQFSVRPQAHCMRDPDEQQWVSMMYFSVLDEKGQLSTPAVVESATISSPWTANKDHVTTHVRCHSFEQ